jgi:hypothetical protein
MLCIQSEVLIKESNDNDKTMSEEGRDLHSQTAESAHKQLKTDKKNSNIECIILLSSRLYQHIRTLMWYITADNFGHKFRSSKYQYALPRLMHDSKTLTLRTDDRLLEAGEMLFLWYQVILYEARKGATNNKIK